MSFDTSPFIPRPKAHAASCMTGFQPWWPESADFGWWRMQFEWPPAGFAPGMDWLMQCWTAPLTMFSASVQAWGPATELVEAATAAVPAVAAEVVERVVVDVPMPAGAPVSVELVEVRLMPPEPVVEPVVEPVAEPVVEVTAAEVVEAVPVQEPTPEDLAPVASGPLSINTATEEELIALKGIGPALAKLIIEKRPYASVDALVDLKGIGPKLVEQLRDQLTV